jgi:hypothetical protein
VWKQRVNEREHTVFNYFNYFVTFLYKNAIFRYVQSNISVCFVYLYLSVKGLYRSSFNRIITFSRIETKVVLCLVLQ